MDTIIILGILVVIGVFVYRTMIRKSNPQTPGPVVPPPPPPPRKIPSYETLYEQCSQEPNTGGQIQYNTLFRVYVGANTEIKSSDVVQLDVIWKTKDGNEVFVYNSGRLPTPTLLTIDGIYYYQVQTPISIPVNTETVDLIAYITITISNNESIIGDVRTFTQDIIFYCREYGH